MKYSVCIEVWIGVDAQDEEIAFQLGMEKLGRCLSELEKAGAEWEMLEPAKEDPDGR